MQDSKEILLHLGAFLRTDAPRLTRLNAYYLGKHDILRAPKDPLKPDNRLVNNFCRNITDCTVGYFMGRGIRYASVDDRTMEMIHRVSTENDERFVNNALAKDLSVCGRAVELLWYDDLLHPRFTPLSPDSVIPVYDTGVDPRLKYAIRYYTKADGKTVVEVYDESDMTVYDYENGILTKKETTPPLLWGRTRDLLRQQSGSAGRF